MRIKVLSISAIGIAAVIALSCSSSKNTASVSGVGKTAHAVSKKKAISSSDDYESLNNYKALANYNPTVPATEKAEQTTMSETAVASSDAKLVAIAEKHTAQFEKLSAGKKLSKVEIKELNKDLKDVKSEVKSTDKSDLKGGNKSQTVAFILALVFWWFTANLIPVGRFYLGGKKNVTNGILQIVFGILTLGIVSTIWGLIDWIRIATGDLKPGNGEYNPKWGK